MTSPANAYHTTVQNEMSAASMPDPFPQAHLHDGSHHPVSSRTLDAATLRTGRSFGDDGTDWIPISMPFQARSAILQEIGAELQAGVLAYVTGDRENLSTEVSEDVLRRVPRHLEAIGKQERLALVLYTLGGDTNTPWPFVNFLRSYCDELYVLVP